MRLAHQAIAALATGAAGAGFAQNTFTYDFQIVVAFNEVITTGAGGQLSTLPVGTLGTLRITLDAGPAGYPGWNTTTIRAYDILSIDLTAGSFSAQGVAAFYPTTTPFLALQLANDEWTDVPQLIRSDAMACFLAWNSPEIAYSSLVIRQDSQPGQVPWLFTGLNLPIWANLALATTRTFLIESAAGGNPAVTFLVYGMQGTPTSQCPGDVNGDGHITPADFSAWIAAYNTGSPACDQNGDDACTPSDFSAWIANYNVGCE